MWKGISHACWVESMIIYSCPKGKEKIPKGGMVPLDRKRCPMATKFNVTRKQALESIIEFAKANEYDNTDVMDVLNNMLSKLQTTSKRSGETAAHKTNAKMLQKYLNLFANGVVLTSREFANNADGFPVDNMGRPSVHKATAILVQGVNDGILVKVSPEKKSKPMGYKLA